MEFQGFQSSLPLWLMIPIGIIVLYLSYRSYRDQNSLSVSLKTILISLRSLAFILLLLLLLNPFFKGFENINDKPDVLVFIDDSKSASLIKGDYLGQESMNEVLNALNLKNTDDINFRSYSIGNSVSTIDLDSVSYSQTETNLFDVYQQIKDSEYDVTSAIIISDGIYTVGRDPVFSLSDVQIPIYSIAIGDTSSINDVILKGIKTQPVGYVNTEHLVEVTIQQNGYPNQEISIELNEGSEVIESKTLNFEGRESLLVNFNVPLRTEALKQYSVNINPVNGEWSTENNSQLFTIEVLDNKIQILSLAFEVHPDIGAIRNVLKSDANVKLIEKTWIQGTNFIEPEDFPSPDSLELVLIHGLPNNQATLSILNSYFDQIPSVLFQTPRGLDLQSNPLYQDYIQLQSYTGTANVGIIPTLSKDEHPILELPEVDYKTLESISSYYRGVTLDALSTPLFNSIFQGIETKQPVIAISETGSLRRVHVNAYGWFQLNQSSRQIERDFFTSLINNIYSWAANKPDNRRLKISPTQQVFNSTESITIDAYLENESGNIEREGRIDIEISDPSGNERTFTMDNNGDGSYNLKVPYSTQGLYSFDAIARKGDRIIDQQSGEFALSPSNSELVNTIRNDELLKQTALMTGGEFVDFKDASSVISRMNEANLFKQNISQREIFDFPVQHPFWFLLVITILAGEWLTRKFYSLP